MARVVNIDSLARQVADNIRENWRTGDVAFTMRHKDFAFGILDGYTLRGQVHQWKSLGAIYDPHNTKQIKINGKRFYMFIIQPADMEVSISPLAWAFNELVNGYAYLTPYKWAIELVATELKDNKTNETD